MLWREIEGERMNCNVKIYYKNIITQTKTATSNCFAKSAVSYSPWATLESH